MASARTCKEALPLSSLFPLHTLKLQTWQLHSQQAPCSANRDLTPQRGLQAPFRLMLVKKPPPFPPILGKNSGNGGPRLGLPWDALRKIQTRALHTTYARVAGAGQHHTTRCPWPPSAHRCINVPVKEELTAISPLSRLHSLDVPTADAVVITVRVIPMSLMRAGYIPPLV